MKKRLSLGVVSLLFVMAALWGSTLAGSQDRNKSAGVPERFIGAWRLVALEVVDADGKVHRGDSTGMFVFTREGRLAVQVMDRTPQAAPHAGPEQYAQGGYEATFGRVRQPCGALACRVGELLKRESHGRQAGS
jgi:hypothetical protein